MKTPRRFLALLLSFSLLLCLFGCTQTPDTADPTEAPTTEPPTEPPADARYAQAKAEVLAMENVTFTLEMVESRYVGGETFRTSTTQTVTFQGLGTGAMIGQVQSKAVYGDTTVESVDYYADGTGYTCVEDNVFSAQLTEEEFTAGYPPVVLLEESLYETVSAEETAGGTELTFANPSGLESWLGTEEAVLVTASGTARLDGSGKLTDTRYCATYTVGNMSVDVEITAKIQEPEESLDLGETISAIQDDAVAVPDLALPAMLLRSVGDILQAQSVTASISTAIVSEAAGCVLYKTEASDLYGTGSDMRFHLDYSNNIMDFSGNTESYTFTEHYEDGVYTYTMEGDEPVTRSGMSPTALRGNLTDEMTVYIPLLSYIETMDVTDTGSNYLISYSLTEEGAEAWCADACYTLFQDENALANLASNYKTTEMTGYLSVDKFTGLPVALGSTFSGTHTISGVKYVLSEDYAQSLFLGSDTAYETITGEPLPEAEPADPATPVFYHVTGADGQEMWLLGTIHVGDARTAFLPREIYDAFDSADALAVEFDLVSFEEQAETDPELQEMITSAYLYGYGSTISFHLDPEVYEAAVAALKATGNYDANGTVEYMRVAVLSNALENSYLQQGYGLSANKGVDRRLLALAREQEKEILDVESAEFQIQMITGYSDPVQELLLKETLSCTSLEYCASAQELFELWCAGDEDALRDAVRDDTSEMTEEELALYEEYNQAMMTDRNVTMLDVATEYLESGKVVFYAVGLAHLLADDGLVNTLRDAGYTVELVTYNE